MNTFIDSDIIFIHKNHPLFPGFEMCAMNRVLFFFFGSFFCFSWIQFKSRKKIPDVIDSM